MSPPPPITRCPPIPGEDEFSYGYDGRGLKVESGRFEEFGQPFGEGDVIGCFAVSTGGGLGGFWGGVFRDLEGGD